MIVGINKGLGLVAANSIGASIIQGATQPKRSFFGRLWRNAVKKIISNVPVLSQIIEILEIDLNNYIYREIGVLDDNGEITLSEIEASYLENWFTIIFSKKYEALLLKANQIYTSNDLKLQVQLLNELNNELAILKEYLKWDNPKLSILAIEQRNEVATELIEEVEHLMYKTIEESSIVFQPINVDVVSTPAMLYPIILMGNVFKAVATNYSLTENETTPIETEPNELITEENKSKTSLSLWTYLLGGAALYKIFK